VSFRRDGLVVAPDLNVATSSFMMAAQRVQNLSDTRGLTGGVVRLLPFTSENLKTLWLNGNWLARSFLSISNKSRKIIVRNFSTAVSQVAVQELALFLVIARFFFIRLSVDRASSPWMVQDFFFRPKA